jgi:hypothetical protein
MKYGISIDYGRGPLRIMDFDPVSDNQELDTMPVSSFLKTVLNMQPNGFSILIEPEGSDH